MIVLSILGMFTKKAGPAATAMTSGSLSEALLVYGSGGRRVNPEFDQTQYWPEIRALMAPYSKQLVAECARVYLDYVEKTGNTACPKETVARKMRELLWVAWRRAGIPNKKKYEKLDRLPDLTPYFVEVVKYLNARESNVRNRVAFFCVENPKTRDAAWFIAPVIPELRKPQMTKGDDGKITATLY